MASKFECPRCGCGIKPGDVQCDRCGEVFRKIEKRQPAPVAPSPVRDISPDVRPERKDLSEADNEKRLELLQKERDLQIREKKLADKELRVADMMESLEKDSATLEDTMGLFEGEKAVLKEKHESMVEREDLLLDLMQRVETGLNELSSYVEKAKAGGLSNEELDKALALKEAFATSYEPERRRLRKEMLDFDVQNIGRVVELEAMLRSAEDKAMKCRAELEAKKELESAEAVDVIPSEALIKDISEAIDEQIGSPYVDTVKGNPVTIGMDKLDTIFGGGIPTGHLILVTGPPGSMKSTLTFNIMYNVAERHKINCLYVSLDQSRESLMKQMSRLNMSMDRVGDRLMIADMIGLRMAKHDEPGDWRAILLRYVKNIYAEKKFGMFVLDSLDSFKSISSHSFSRQDLQDLFDWFKELGITVFMIGEGGTGDATDASQEAYLSDGVIEMRMKELSDSRVQRWLRIAKMRGMNIDTRFYAMLHNGEHFIFTLPMVESQKGQ